MEGLFLRWFCLEVERSGKVAVVEEEKKAEEEEENLGENKIGLWEWPALWDV